MLLSCSSCNSKYLLNSADLKPNGRDVKCALCGHEWYQEANTNTEDLKDLEILKENKNIENKKSTKENFNTNLPSTYVKEHAPKTINSVIVIIVDKGGGKIDRPKVAYPFFPPHLCFPVKVGEQVWVFKDYVFVRECFFAISYLGLWGAL